EYDPHLATRPQIIAVSKQDLPQAQERWPELRAELEAQGYHPVSISAVTHEGLDELLRRTVALLREERRERQKEESEQLEVIEVKPRPDYFEVERKRKTFYVRGEDAERLAIMTDLESDEAIYRLQQRLRRMGVLAALQRAGIQEGGRVRIGDVEFTWDSSFEPRVKPHGRRHGSGARSRR
ncbi:MAG TPA: Obg family GTPase CgtA, partial [Chloroflexota bacterium]